MTAGGLVLLRHGETQWSKSGRHTGLTDIELTDEGKAAAASVRPLLAGREFRHVLISPLRRAQQTAALAGLSGETDPDLHEWDYGAFEGRRTEEIRAERRDPAWSIWTTMIPPGETPGESVASVGARADRVLARVLPIVAEGGQCALVAHGHFLRILTARWLGLSADDGRLFALDPGTVSRLGYEHETRVIRSWNAGGLAPQPRPQPGSSG